MMAGEGGGYNRPSPGHGAVIPFTNIFQGIDTQGGLKVTNNPLVIPLDFVNIKDDFYGHDPLGANPGEVTILHDGLYKISAMLTVVTVSASQGSRGNPQLHIELNIQGGGWVEQPDAMGGYIRENSTQSLSCSITGIGFFQFQAGDKLRLTTYDSVPNEPDEETVAFSQRLLIEFVRP
jgi:hypothetical protein